MSVHVAILGDVVAMLIMLLRVVPEVEFAMSHCVCRTFIMCCRCGWDFDNVPLQWPRCSTHVQTDALGCLVIHEVVYDGMVAAVFEPFARK